MNDIAAIKELLLKRKQEIEETIATVASQDPTQQDPWYDRENTQDDDAQEREGKTRADALMRQNQDQLQDVTRALAKIEAGTYGICDVCGKPIDPARLAMVPEASLCIDDQKTVE